MKPGARRRPRRAWISWWEGAVLLALLAMTVILFVMST
jgi:hypothetical protein